MKAFEILSGSAYVVELPEGAVDRFLTLKKDGLICRIPQQGVDALDKFEAIKLPPGNWRIIGMLSEVTEEEAAGLVEPNGNGDYRNYVGAWGGFATAIQSLESAILAEGWYFQHPQGDTPLYYTDRFTGEQKIRPDWEYAQSRVLDRSRCLLLGREGA